MFKLNYSIHLLTIHASYEYPWRSQSFSPRIHLASWISLGWTVTCLAWMARRLVSYLELGLHLVNPDHTPSKHNPNHTQGPKWTSVTVDRPTHWAPSARAHHSRNTWYLIPELTWTRADYHMTHSCNHTTRSMTNKDHLITSQHTVVITAT